MQMFFDNWAGVYRTLILGVLSYVALVFLLRISGPRTLSKMNAFDLIVTVALGSTLATILLNKNVQYVEGVLALGLLIGLQYLVTWSSVRVPWIKHVVTGEPRLLLYEGKSLSGALRNARVMENEIDAAIRGTGAPSRNEVRAVVLETDGSLTVIRGEEPSEGSTLANVKNYD